jgi:hypothetical protein
VGVRHGEADAAEATGPDRAQEGRPEGVLLAVTNRKPEDLAIPFRRHPGGDEDRLGHHRRPLVSLDVRRVEAAVREGDVLEPATPSWRQLSDVHPVNVGEGVGRAGWRAVASRVHPVNVTAA